MRKLLLTSMLSLPLMLGGCATVGTGTSGFPFSVAGIQAAAVAACKFLPTAATVANVLAGANPAVATAESIASAICAAVVTTTSVTATPAGAQGLFAAPATPARVPMVNGVVIKGKFVK